MPIRVGKPTDLPALTDIYNHYIVNTAITFDTNPFTVQERREWFDKFREATRYQLWVIEEAGAIQGYASSSPLRPKPAYDTSVETSIYLHPTATGRGLGRQLYDMLFASLIPCNVHRCYGIITIPNEASTALHRAIGFSEVAHLHEVGHKFGRYWDTLWFEKSLV